MTRPACRTCVFYEPRPLRVADEPAGVCVRHAPRPAADAPVLAPASWPIVAMSYRCGEHQPATPTASPDGLRVALTPFLAVADALAEQSGQEVSIDTDLLDDEGQPIRLLSGDFEALADAWRAHCGAEA